MNAGFGTLILANTVGAGVNFYFNEPSRWRAFLGTGLNYISVSDLNDSAFDGEVNTSVLYQNFKAGAEFTADNGFFFSLHVAAFLFFTADTDQRVYFVGVPALSIGKYF